MGDYTKKLRERLEKVWEPADFTKLFSAMPDQRPHRIKKGTLLFSEGDPLGRLYFIQDGFVKLYRLSEEGRETTSYLFGPGHVLGVRALLSKDERTKNNAEALTDLTVITISRGEYFDAIVSNPEFLVDLVHVFTNRLTYTERKLEGFIFGDTTARVANFLTDCAWRFGLPARRQGRENKGKITLPLELTHQRIAELVGAFRETVTLALHRLEKEKILRSDRGKITILDLDKLHQHSLMGRRT